MTDTFSPAQTQWLDNVTMKSFTTGYGITPDSQLGAGALRREFLEDTVTMLTYTNDDLTLFRELAKRKADSPVVQYPRYLEHGQVGHANFTPEIGIANISDPRVRQKLLRMKYLSATKQISLPAQISNNVTDPLALLTDDAIIQIASSIEWASFYGDSNLTDQADEGGGIEFDGLVNLIDASNVIDNRGESLSEVTLNHAATVIGKGFGKATDAFMPIGVLADFTNQKISSQRQIMSDNAGNMAAGFGITSVYTSRGQVQLHGSTIMENGNILNTEAPILATAPSRPTATATVGGTTGKFTASDIATGLSYMITTSSDDATSSPSDVVSATLTAATQAVTLAININPMFQQRPQFVSVYRKGLETGMYYLIARVPASEAVSNVVTIVDNNDTIPETADVFVGQLDPNVISLYEFLPMTRIVMGQVSSALTFSIYWYGALALFAPRKWVRIKNVKYVATSNVLPVQE